jgi:hypothetical protein
LTYLEAISAFNFSAKSESALGIIPGLGAGDLLLFRLLPRGLDVELRTVRDLGFVEPASALMFEGERARRGDTAMLVYVQKEAQSKVFGNNDKGDTGLIKATAESLSVKPGDARHGIKPTLERVDSTVYKAPP